MKKLIISFALLTGVVFSSCNDSFLEKTPITDLTEDNAFNSYDNFKSFMWPCYEMFTNNTMDKTVIMLEIVMQAILNGNKKVVIMLLLTRQ